MLLSSVVSERERVERGVSDVVVGDANRWGKKKYNCVK